MGTSKGYIAPTRPEWSKAKRAISTYLRNRDPEARRNAISKYAEARHTGRKEDTTGSLAFSSAVRNVLYFASAIANSGLDDTLSQFGLRDLMGMSPENVVHELIEHFANHGSTVEDSLALAALSEAFEALEVETTDDLSKMNLDAFLLEVVIAFINNDFDFCFTEKIGKGRTPEETFEILKEVHAYIDGVLRNGLAPVDIKNIDFSKIASEKIVCDILDEAFSTCMNFHGVEE